MKIYCTYCSSEKSKVKEKLPAINRYISQRINSIYDLAKKENIPFYILSGKFGLIDSDELIEFYDHLLLEHEVPDHVGRVAYQLKELRITHMIFFGNSISKDQNLKPYNDCITLACKQANVELDIIEINK